MQKDIPRVTKSAVTVFPFYIDSNGNKKYLLLKRNINKKVDPGVVNGVGGKVENITQNENFFQAAVRELKEETGIEKDLSDLDLLGIINFLSGYEDDWMNLFFRIEITQEEASSVITEIENEDGVLMWYFEDEIKNRDDLITDLYYIWDDIRTSMMIFSATAKMDDTGKEIKNFNISRIPR